jgi:hypothetical protein
MLWGAAPLVLSEQVAVLLVQTLGAEGGNLDEFVAEMEVGQAEAAADDAAVTKQSFHLTRGSIRDDIEVLGLTPEEEVPDTAPHKPGDEAAAAETIEDLKGIGADLLPGDRMGGTWDYAGDAC